MALPSDLMARSPAEAARRIAMQRLDEAREAARDWLEENAASSLHDFRVALRRTRSTLRAWKSELKGSGSGRIRRKLRDIQRETNASRDSEVGLAWLAEQASSLDERHRAGFELLRKRWEKRLAKTTERVREMLRAKFEDLERRLHPRLERMRVELHLAEEASGGKLGVELAERLREHADELSRRLSEITTPTNRARAHAARIQLKRLRYLAEPAEEFLPKATEFIERCKQLQDVLGELNDSHSASAEIDEALDSIAGGDPDAQHPAHAGLLELAVRCETRREQLFAALERDWLGEGKATLQGDAQSLARACEAAARSGLEIERKFLLSALPPLPRGSSAQEIEQGWLPGRVLRERIRRVRDEDGTRYFRTLKLGKGVARTELEEPTTSDVFDALWPLTSGARVHKVRYRVADGEWTWEIDEFIGRELWLAEIELDDADRKVLPPPWLEPWIVRDVTDEKGFTNLELATAGEP